MNKYGDIFEVLHKAEEQSSIGLVELNEQLEILEHHLENQCSTEEALSIAKKAKAEIEQYEGLITSLLAKLRVKLEAKSNTLEIESSNKGSEDFYRMLLDVVISILLIKDDLRSLKAEAECSELNPQDFESIEKKLSQSLKTIKSFRRVEDE